MTDDNDQTRDAPGGEAQRSWLTVAGAAFAGAVASDVYNGAKAAAGAVLDKIRNEPPDPPPSSGSASDSEA